MCQLLEIEDGPTVELQARPAQGTRHDVAFGILVGTGERVAVKVERTPGALTRERAALASLGNSDGPVPRLVAWGAAVLGGERVRCLVSEHRPGSPPTSIEGWRRMGRAYGRLARLQALPSGLPVFDCVAFGRMHARRISDLGDLLAPYVAGLSDWRLLSSAQVPGLPPLVITHGDPGPGNFLDDGRGGTIIDWEEAQIAPRGLDLARLVLIALLGSGPSGYVAREHDARARAVASGYLDVVRGEWQPSSVQWRWWIAAAAVQFIHRRWQLDGRPAPWQDAADVLHAVLADDTWAIPIACR